MYCKNCGNEVANGAAVCLKCGVKVGEGVKYCGHCGAQPDPLASVCVNCGHTLKGDAQKAENSNSKGVDSFGDAVKSCFGKYATFSGRANRSEYWYFVLFTFLCGIIPFLGYLASLVFLIPGIAVAVRRLHDLGKSGWNYLFVLIPLVGPILLIIWFCQPSQEGENQYGPNPNM